MSFKRVTFACLAHSGFFSLSWLKVASNIASTFWENHNLKTHEGQLNQPYLFYTCPVIGNVFVHALK